MSYPILVITTPPASEPVTLAEVKAKLGINITAFDSELTNLITTAREIWENKTGRAIMPTHFRAYFKHWHGRLFLNVGNTNTITDVKYLDSNATEQTLSTSLYNTDVVSMPGSVWLKSTTVAPTLAPELDNRVYVDFVAGFSTVPERVRTAIKMLACSLYKNESNLVSDSSVGQILEVPLSFQSSVSYYRTGIIGQWHQHRQHNPFYEVAPYPYYGGFYGY